MYYELVCGRVTDGLGKHKYSKTDRTSSFKERTYLTSQSSSENARAKYLFPCLSSQFVLQRKCRRHIRLMSNLYFAFSLVIVRNKLKTSFSYKTKQRRLKAIILSSLRSISTQAEVCKSYFKLKAPVYKSTQWTFLNGYDKVDPTSTAKKKHNYT